MEFEMVTEGLGWSEGSTVLPDGRMDSSRPECVDSSRPASANSGHSKQ
jgi:hypothetical protein